MAGERASAEPGPGELAGLSPAEGKAWSGFLTTNQRLIRKLDAELAFAYGVSLRSYEVLREVAGEPDTGVRMAELARRVAVSRQGLTAVVQRLENDGLLRRTPDPEDRRASPARLTTAGQCRLRDAHATHLAAIREHFLGRLTDGEIDALGEIWKKLERG